MPQKLCFLILELMKNSIIKLILLVLISSGHLFVCAQTPEVEEHVELPLPTPEGTKYSPSQIKFQIGYLYPVGNPDQQIIRAFNTGGFELALAYQKALNKRIGIGFQTEYQYLKYGVNTNDTIGQTFKREKLINYKHFFSTSVFATLYLGNTYFKPKLDFGAGVGLAVNNRFIEHGNYLQKGVDAALKYSEDEENVALTHALARLTIRRFYIQGKYYFDPVLQSPDGKFDWHFQLSVGFR